MRDLRTVGGKVVQIALFSFLLVLASSEARAGSNIGRCEAMFVSTSVALTASTDQFLTLSFHIHPEFDGPRLLTAEQIAEIFSGRALVREKFDATVSYLVARTDLDSHGKAQLWVELTNAIRESAPMFGSSMFKASQGRYVFRGASGATLFIDRDASIFLTETLPLHDGQVWEILWNRLDRKSPAPPLKVVESWRPGRGLSAREQLEQKRVALVELQPQLSNSQIDRFHEFIVKKGIVGQVEGTNIDQLTARLPPDLADSVRFYVKQLEEFLGKKSTHLILRNEDGPSVSGHVHLLAGYSTTVAVAGKGSFFRLGGRTHQVETGQTMILRDGEGAIYHGTPVFDGRRVFISVIFAE